MICEQCTRIASVRVAFGTEKGMRLRGGKMTENVLCLKHAMELWNRCRVVIESGIMQWENKPV